MQIPHRTRHSRVWKHLYIEFWNIGNIFGRSSNGRIAHRPGIQSVIGKAGTLFVPVVENNLDRVVPKSQRERVLISLFYDMDGFCAAKTAYVNWQSGPKSAFLQRQFYLGLIRPRYSPIFSGSECLLHPGIVLKQGITGTDVKESVIGDHSKPVAEWSLWRMLWNL